MSKESLISHLRVEVLKRPCALMLKIEYPMDTIKGLAIFFMREKIKVDTMQMKMRPSGEAMLFINYFIEKEMFGRILMLLEVLPGIVELERLEGSSYDW